MRGSAKWELLSKIHLPTTVTQWWNSPGEYFNWINVGYGDISGKGSYPYSYFNTLYDSLHSGFTFSLTKLNAKSWANLILSFTFREGVISSSKLSAEMLSPMKEKSKENYYNTHALLFFCKTSNLRSWGTHFLSFVFVHPGSTSKVPFSNSSNNLEKNYGSL